jgi:hypothetical protein
MTPEYLNMADAEAEAYIFNKLTLYAEYERKRWGEVGLMADTVEKKELWRSRVDPADGFPCRSFARWAHLSPYPYATLYAAKADVQALSDVPADDLAQIPQGNFKTLKQLSTAVRRDPEVLQAARGRSEVFIAHLQANHPDQHVEKDTIFKVPLNETQMKDVEDAIAKALERGCDSRSEVVWMWAVEELSKNETPLAEIEDGKCGHA